MLRLNKARLEREQAAVAELLAMVDDFAKAHALLTQPLVPCFAPCSAASALLRRMGGHAFGAGTEEATARALDAARQLLPAINLLPFQRRRKRHRVPKVIPPTLSLSLTLSPSLLSLHTPFSPSPRVFRARPSLGGSRSPCVSGGLTSRLRSVGLACRLRSHFFSTGNTFLPIRSR